MTIETIRLSDRENEALQDYARANGVDADTAFKDLAWAALQDRVGPRFKRSATVSELPKRAQRGTNQ